VSLTTLSSWSFDWSSSRVLLGVIVKAGPGANVYPGGTSGAGLETPDRKDVSHVLFCYAAPLI
jgi:hypothetical protein